MSDAVNRSGRSVPIAQLLSGAKVPKKVDIPDSPRKAVDSVVAGVDKAKQSVERITEAATARIEVIRQNEASSRTKIEDVDEALRLSENLRLNIQDQERDAKVAHDLDKEKIKELLK
jgi:hypothetical protein